MKKISLLLIIALVYSLAPHQATAKNDWTYGSKSESHFKRSATNYYLNEKKPNSTESVLSGVQCQPNNVEVNYGDYGKDEYAHVVLPYLAFSYIEVSSILVTKYALSPDLIKAAYDQGYCRIFYNQEYRETRASACATFIHEYGHLLGKQHNNNISSPMYTGYTKYQGTKAQKLLDRNRKRIFGKSKCDNSTY